ncbi:MAG: universal stress protein [Deltaproteobacteria bacterium]|nr:universal stress protein [Deltaproteobacteria bacterium]
MLVATDLSEQSLCALEFAAAQYRTRAEELDITLLTIIEDPRLTTVAFDPEFASVIGDDPARDMEHPIRGRLRTLADQFFPRCPVHVDTFRGTSAVGHDIATYARARSCSELVIATHGRSGLGRLLMGSVAEETLRHSPCATFVIPSRPGARHAARKDRPPRILVLTDFSPEAECVFPHARRQAEALKELHPQIILLHVIDDVLSASYHMTLGCDVESIWGELQQRAESEISAIHARHFPSELVVTTVTRQEKSIGADIVNFAKARDVDLIILSTHGRRGVQHLLLGSVAERVIRTTDCPALIVPVGGFAMNRLS